MSTKEQISIDEKKTLHELLEGSYWMFQHPMLRHIINSAPTPKSADMHLCRMLHPLPFANKLGQTVRRAVMARQIVEKRVTDWKNVWELLTTCSTEMKIGRYNKQGNFPLEVMTEFNWFPNEDWMNKETWPFLLREFKTNSYYTLPEDPKKWETIRSIDEEDVRRFNWGYNPQHNEGSTEIFLNPECKSARFQARVGSIFIKAVNTLVNPPENAGIPRFYKVIVMDHYQGKIEEEILIVCPIDRLMFSDKGDQLDGYMVYKKTIELMNGIKAVLRLHFTIQSNGNLLIECRNKPFVSIETGNDGFEVTRDKFSALQKTAETNFAELFSLSVSLWEKTDKFNNLHLHQFTDFHVISNPVKNLHELFTRNESS